MNPIFIGPDELRRVRTVQRYALDHPLVSPVGPRAALTEYSVHFPGGLVAVFSITRDSVRGDTFRHLSVSVDEGNEPPPIELVGVLARLFAFTDDARFQCPPGPPWIAHVYGPHS